jgi:secretion/DNA translocation related TadE-like protein
VRPRRRDEAGFAVPVAIGLGGVLVALALAGTAGGQVLVAQRRAATAADLSALAGAVAAQQGQDPCAAAGRVAELDHARMADCEVEEDRVRVVAEVSLTLAGHDLKVRARAHAGPRSAG